MGMRPAIPGNKRRASVPEGPLARKQQCLWQAGNVSQGLRTARGHGKSLTPMCDLAGATLGRQELLTVITGESRTPRRRTRKKGL